MPTVRPVHDRGQLGVSDLTPGLVILYHHADFTVCYRVESAPVNGWVVLSRIGPACPDGVPHEASLADMGMEPYRGDGGVVSWNPDNYVTRAPATERRTTDRDDHGPSAGCPSLHRRGRGVAVSLYDFFVARTLVAKDVPVDALLMAAAMRADDTNRSKLRSGWPGLVAETEARYNAPGGVLPNDPPGGGQ